MALRWTKILALAALVGAAACGDDEPMARGQGAGGTGGDGTGGVGGNGGGGGSDERACSEWPVPDAPGEERWRDDFHVAGFSGLDGVVPAVHDLEVHPDGDLVASGYFTWVDRQQVGPIVRLQDGTFSPLEVEWTGGAAPFEIGALAFGPEGRQAVATLEQVILPLDPEPTAGTVYVEGDAGLQPIGDFIGQIRDLVWVGEELWAAGGFILEDEGLAHLAIWDGGGWKAPPGGAVDAPVGTFFQDEGILWVGGEFEQIGGIEARIAGWNGSEWIVQPVDFGGVIYALDRDETGALFAGGVLIGDEGGTGGSIFRHLGEGRWELVGGGVGQGFGLGVVSDIAFFEGELFISGCFTHVGGDASSPEAAPTSPLARWTGDAWVAVGPDPTFSAWYDPMPCGPLTGRQRMRVHDGLLYVAGNFPSTDGVASQSLVTWDGDRWAPAGGRGGHGITGYVEKLAVGGPGCSVFAYGALTHGGGTPTSSRLLRWYDGWQAVGGDHPDPIQHRCEALLVDDEGVPLLGCAIWPSDGSEPRGEVFAVGSSWKPLEAEERLPPVFGLGRDATGRLWAVGGLAQGFVARQDDEGRLVVVEDGFDGPVRLIAFGPATDEGEQAVLVAGDFSQVGGVEATRIAIRDDEGWSPLGGGLPTSPRAIAWARAGIYASTSFEGLTEHLLLGFWDGSSWRELGTEANGLPPPADPGAANEVHALLAHGDDLIVAGQIFSGERSLHALHWDGTTFTPVGGGVGALAVEAAALAPEGLWLGGGIAEAGSEANRIPSVGVAILEREERD